MNRHKNLKVIARFKPRTTSDLDAELLNLVGQEAEFRYHMLLDEDDTPYSDQWVLTTDDKRFGDYWYPESDLEILQEKHSD